MLPVHQKLGVVMTWGIYSAFCISDMVVSKIAHQWRNRQYLLFISCFYLLERQRDKKDRERFYWVVFCPNT